MGISRQFEKLNALFQIGFVRVLEPLDLALAAVLFLAPAIRHFLEEGRIDEPIQLVNVHGVDSVVEALIFRLMPLDRFGMFAPLVGVAGVKGVPDPFQHFIVEPQPAEKFREFRLQHLLPNIFAAARRWVALALICVPGAMVIGVPLLLDLTDHGAAALVTRDQSREREIMLAPFGFPCEAAIKHALHALPELEGDDGFVGTPVLLAVPVEAAGEDLVPENRADRAHRQLRAALPIDEAFSLGLARKLLQRNIAASVPLEQLCDDRRDAFVDHDDLFAVGTGRIAIAKRRE